jgi:cephalosporin-C deacetylase
VPGLLQTPHYGSVNHIPDFHDRERYAVLQLMHRGQRLADQPFAATYPGLLTHGISEPGTYIYRAIVADCLRAAEFLASRSEIDSTRIGMWGDDLALITAARRPIFRAVLATDLLLYRLLDQAARSHAYPVEELNDLLRAQPEQREAVAHTLSYFDVVAHAPAVQAATLLPSGDDPEWLRPLREALGDRCEDYRITHRGAIDQRWLDAWLAGQLGSEPRARFLARA